MTAPVDALLATDATPLAMRWLHVLALAVVFGGAVVLGVAAEVPSASARRYEYAFWVALGVLVLTGVGNVGALAPTVPGASTAWGRQFTLKLLSVLLFVLFSLVRTGVVTSGQTDAIVARAWYAVTAAWVAIVIGLGVMLAHA